MTFTHETPTTAEVLAQLDHSVRPQDDFFRFVNGTWLRTTNIPADQSSAGTFIDLRNESERRVRKIIEELSARAAAGEELTDQEQKIGHLFTSFMDENTVNSLGARPLEPDLALIRAARTKTDLAAALGTLARTGVSVPFFLEIDADRNAPESYITWIGQSGLGLPDEAYYHAPEHAETLAQYREFIPKLWALVFGDDGANAAAHTTAYTTAHTTASAVTPEKISPETAAQIVINIETSLASHHFTVVEERDVDKTNNVLTWDEFITSAHGFDWDTALANIGVNEYLAPTLLVYTPRALTGFAHVWETTPIDELRVYLAWHVLTSRAAYLSSDIVQTNFDFYGRILSGQEQIRDRWKRGVRLVDGVMGEAVGRVYVQQYFPSDYKTQMEQLVADLLQAYRESISSLDWMTAQTKDKALEKLNQFTPKIAYPDRWRDYTALTVTNNDLVGNIRAANEYETDYNLAKLGTPVDRSEWFMNPQTVNAYYNPTMNEIVFPAAILQPPFFTAGADAAWNYGSIGAVIGHEIGHGFDDQGSKYDGTGKLHNWWTDADRQAFEARTAALVKQYDAYVPQELCDIQETSANQETDSVQETSPVQEAGTQSSADSTPHVNGELTLGENIGDLGGVTIALKAYDIALRREGLAGGIADAPVIDGVTGVQRFFISYALSWQEKRRQELIMQLLAVDPHSPAEFRCNGIVKNVDAFAEAWNVQPGDALYLAPAERVKIW